MDREGDATLSRPSQSSLDPCLARHAGHCVAVTKASDLSLQSVGAPRSTRCLVAREPVRAGARSNPSEPALTQDGETHLGLRANVLPFAGHAGPESSRWSPTPFAARKTTRCSRLREGSVLPRSALHDRGVRGRGRGGDSHVERRREPSLETRSVRVGSALFGADFALGLLARCLSAREGGGPRSERMSALSTACEVRRARGQCSSFAQFAENR